MSSTQPQTNTGARTPARLLALSPPDALYAAALLLAPTPRGIPKHGITRGTKLAIKIPAKTYLEWRRANDARKARREERRLLREQRAAMPPQRKPSERAAAKKAVGKITKRD